MRKLFFTSSLSILMLASLEALAKDETFKTTVDEWSCAGCAKRSAKALKQIDGIKKVETNYDKKELTVVFDDSQIKKSDVEAAIKKIKYNCD